jgi:hypothetical protein
MDFSFFYLPMIVDQEVIFCTNDDGKNFSICVSGLAAPLYELSMITKITDTSRFQARLHGHPVIAPDGRQSDEGKHADMRNGVSDSRFFCKGGPLTR